MMTEIRRKKDIIEEIARDSKSPLTLSQIMEKHEEMTGETVTKMWIKSVVEEIEGYVLDQVVYKGNVYNVVKEEGQEVKNYKPKNVSRNGKK